MKKRIILLSLLVVAILSISTITIANSLGPDCFTLLQIDINADLEEYYSDINWCEDHAGSYYEECRTEANHSYHYNSGQSLLNYDRCCCGSQQVCCGY